MTAPRVLVVDDVEANIIAIEALLEGTDCDVVRAGSGLAALREILEHDFAVVLLDVQMPGMDGFEVARLIRENQRSRATPIVFLTAMLESAETVFAGYESGAVDVLFKPVNPHVLFSKVQVFLELDRSKRRLADEIAAHERTLAELDAFNYSVSHDLRAPLRPLNGFSKILLEDYGHVLDDEGKRLLGRISSAANRMDALISDLLRLSQVSRAKPVHKPLDVATIARSVMSEIKLNDGAREVSFDCPDALPASGDDRLLRIALENLLRNAWKFTSKTDGAAIEVGQRKIGAVDAFYVKDNGAGFDPAQASKLFAPFQRLHAKEDFDGTGIGLAIVQRIIHHHRGSVWAEATPNHGATFFFTLAS